MLAEGVIGVFYSPMVINQPCVNSQGHLTREVYESRHFHRCMPLMLHRSRMKILWTFTFPQSVRYIYNDASMYEIGMYAHHRY
jgi:hypothetical protein